MDLSHADAMALLFDDLTPHLERENGEAFNDISVLIATSARAVVLAPRLEAAACAVVTGRITDAQRNPWQVELNVTRSEFYSDEYARLELQPSRVQPDGETRGTTAARSAAAPGSPPSTATRSWTATAWT